MDLRWTNMFLPRVTSGPNWATGIWDTSSISPRAVSLDQRRAPPIGSRSVMASEGTLKGYSESHLAPIETTDGNIKIVYEGLDWPSRISMGEMGCGYFFFSSSPSSKLNLVVDINLWYIYACVCVCVCVCVRTDYITIRDVSFKKERGRQRERERERDSRITSIKASKNTQQQPRFDGRFLLLFFFLFWFFFPAAVVAPVFIFSPSRSIPFTVFFCEMMMQFSWPVVVSFGLEFQRRRGRRRIVQEQRVLHFHLARLSKKKNRSSLRKQNQTVQKSKRKPRKTINIYYPQSYNLL